MVIFAEKQSFGYGQTKSDPLKRRRKKLIIGHTVSDTWIKSDSVKKPGFETVHMNYIFQPNLGKPKK